MEPLRTAYIFSPWVSIQQQSCLQFSHFTFGPMLNSLAVYLQHEDMFLQILWNKTLAIDRTWIMERLSISLSVGWYRIGFVGFRNFMREVTVLVDNVTLTVGACMVSCKYCWLRTSESNVCTINLI